MIRVSNGAIYRHWQQGTDYDVYIDEFMRQCCWIQIKRCIKLNNNEATRNHGKDGYNPAHKFYFIWRTLAQNMNLLTKDSCLDLTDDEIKLVRWIYHALR